jgi:hypothetical protein
MASLLQNTLDQQVKRQQARQFVHAPTRVQFMFSRVGRWLLRLE